MTIQISISEMQTYLRCGRQWNYTSPHREGLRRLGLPNLDLHTGSIVHAGLAAPVFGRNPMEEIDRYINAEMSRIEREYKDSIGTGLSFQEKASLEGSHQLAKGMVSHYFLHYGIDAVQPYKFLAAEFPFRIPCELPGVDEPIFFVGTIDGLLEDPHGGLYILENKSFSRETDVKWLKTSPQFVWYTWAMSFLLNTKIKGVLYNGLRKKLPTVPRVLKNGMLSVASIDTTVETYRATLLSHHGSDWEDSKSLKEYYGDRLRVLERRTDNPFFIRHKLTFTPQQLDECGKNAFRLVEEMVRAPRTFPFFQGGGCTFCPVDDLCIAFTTWGDDSYLRSRQYRKTPHRDQYAAMEAVEPATVGSVADLRTWLDSQG